MRTELKVNPTLIFITFILFVGILPAPIISGFTMPWQYLFAPIFLFVLLLIALGYIKLPKFGKITTTLWILIILEVIFSAVFAPMFKLNSFSFPTEAMQYIIRFLIFLFFIAIFYNKNINLEKFMKRFLVILLMGMGVGFMQFLDLPGSSFFRSAYAYSDNYLDVMMRENLSSRRISGVAQHPTSNGGIAAFTFISVITMFLFYKKKYWLTLLGLSLVLINIIGGQARMGYVTIAFSILAIYLMYNYVYKKGVKSTVNMGFITALIGSVIYWLYSRGNDFVVKAVYRWETLGESISMRGDRIAQIDIGLSLLQTPFDYLFGVSKEVEGLVRALIEVEPINIFILYGLVGFLLQYGLIVILLIYLFKNVKVIKQYPILLTMVVMSFITLLSYQVFSLAYYFFREIHVGLIPWILLGATIGAVERFKKVPDQFEEYKGELKVRKRKRYRITW